MTVTRLRIGCLLLLVALFAPLANANTVPDDPRIIINDPICSPFSITNQTFTFNADANGVGVLCFTNDSGVAWTNLSINVLQPPNTVFPDAFFCGSDIWATCTLTLLPGNIVNIFFTDGILPPFNNVNGFQFTIDLTPDDPTCATCGWGANAQFTAVANVPEPGTLSLFLAGIGTLVARRRLRKGART